MSSIYNFSINKKSRRVVNFLVGCVVLLAILVIPNLFFPQIKNGMLAISLPFQKTLWTAGESSSGFLGSFLKAGSFSKENENLKIENQKLLSQLAFLSSVEQGDQAQRDVSVACQNSEFGLVMAGISGLDNNDVLSINKGSVDGISEGMPVINQQNVLFGKVLKVYKNFSEVILISNKNSIINVKIQQIESGESVIEVDGVVKGVGGLNAYLDLVPIINEINTNDILVTSALEGSFPKDLLVGKIIQEEKNDQKPFQQAQISLFLDVKTVDNLFVITNYKKDN